LITVRSGYGIRGSMENAARDAGVQLRIGHEVSLLCIAVALAANGLGVVVVPPSIVPHEPRLVSQRLMRPTIERAMGVYSKRERSFSPPAQAYLEVLKQETDRRRDRPS